MSCDVIVVGAGHNGLTAALCLAAAGRRVLALERRDRVGGLCALEEFHPGFLAPGLLQDTASFRADLARRLSLDRHGLILQAEEPPLLAWWGQEGGLKLYRHSEKAAPEIASFSKRDAEAYRRWKSFLGEVRGFVESLLNRPPPPLKADSATDLLSLGLRGLALRRLGEKNMLEFLRIAPMCAADWLNEWFETPFLAEALAAPAVIGGFVGPWAAGTVATLLMHECASERSVAGGPAALIRALSSACKAAGVEVRLNAAVDKIRLASGRVSGVVLEDGEEIAAPAVAASCDPKTTFLQLIGPSSLPMRVEKALRRFRSRGSTAAMRLALNGPLEIRGRGGEPFEAIRIGGGHLDDLERAFDALKYGRVSERPHLEVRVPTVSTPDLADPDGHVVTILASCAPHRLNGGWTQQPRRRLAETIIGRLAEATVDLRSRLTGFELLTPTDIEMRYGVCGGHIHHGEHSLDQLLCMRPAPIASRYAAPIPGLYLAGSGSHPGGGVTGMPGALAADAILKSG